MKSGPSCVHLKKDPLMRSRKFLLAAALLLAGAAEARSREAARRNLRRCMEISFFEKAEGTRKGAGSLRPLCNDYQMWTRSAGGR